MRMQEGTLSLMQMAKTSSVCVKHAEAGLPYISVMADPTFGGSTASYASLATYHSRGNRVPGSAFAGPLATASIKTANSLKNFQKAEFLLEHGMIDRIVQRSEMRSLLIDLLDFCVDLP